ncbi:MAG: DUF58 domain-containing protein [Myxococcales bacterium]|nr:DUF58 domain-containing protein [Myxococcales bacterium]MCB9651849.1 DUF58 domain-containing protein [Deltaproteobacteria bacterium]
MRARTVADSALAGMHRSRHHGTSVEFAEHKEYSPGDNVRHLDWRAFARFDRDYIKRFEDEANLRALMVVDSSGSMGYPAGKDVTRLTKLQYATTCAGAMAYVLARQGDAVGLATFRDKLDIKVPSKARRGHLQEILTNLDALVPEGPSSLATALDRLSEGLTRRSIVVVFSDLLDGGLAALPGMARLRARKHDVVLFHTLDPDELDFPFEDSTEFLSMEDDRRVQIDARAIKDAYDKELKRFLAQAEAGARSARVEYVLARTDQAPGQLVAHFLARRMNARAQAR